MTQLLQNAAYGTALILAVVLLRRVLKDRLVPGARLCLWAVCLFRLLTPAAPASALSLWGLFSKPAPMPVQTPQGYAPAPVLDAPALQPTAPGFSCETALVLVWLAVGLILAVRYALIWRRTRRAVANAIPLGRDDPRYALLPKCARLREGAMEGAPLTFGVVRPTVVLTPGLDGEALECVLAHEGVHASRRDNLWHYAMALALAVHWWNPAVWLMSRLLRRDIELSCDRAAVKKLGEDRRADYASTLVTLATQGEGPAFCQTFGRKAAEERIISIMKYKKITILGVVLTLTLVLAVTLAFASEPKTDNGTIQFHGQTFQRDQLSQGTLDWLDWYLTLSEEEQLAISYVPAELNRGRDVSTQDAYSSEKAASEMIPLPNKTSQIQSGFPEVDPDDVDLSEMKELLDQKVADGKITQEEADQRLADTEEMLEKARRGELKLFWYDSGDGESWVYGVGAFLTNGETESRFVDPGRVLQPLYRDENGKLVPVDPDTVVSGYVLGDPSQPDLPTYVETGESVADGAKLIGEANIKYDEGKTAQDYDVHFPTFDEDGNSVNNGVIGSRFYDYEIQPSDGAADGGAVSAPSASPAPAPTVQPAESMADIYAENGYDVDENGYGLVYDENGQLFMKARWGCLPCIRTDCAISQEHYHKHGQVVCVDNPTAVPAAHHSEIHHSETHHSEPHH